MGDKIVFTINIESKRTVLVLHLFRQKYITEVFFLEVQSMIILENIIDTLQLHEFLFKESSKYNYVSCHKII